MGLMKDIEGDMTTDLGSQKNYRNKRLSCDQANHLQSDPQQRYAYRSKSVDEKDGCPSHGMYILNKVDSSLYFDLDDEAKTHASSLPPSFC